MKTFHVRRTAPALVAAAALAGGLLVGLGVAAGPAAAAAPPFEPDSSAVGTVTFYNAAGNVITTGSTAEAPFAAYAVGSALPRATDKQAQLVFASPRPDAIPAAWYREAVGNYTAYPLTTGPAVIRTASQSMPVVAGTSDDQTLDGFESDSQISTVDGYENVVQVRMKTASSANQPTSTYDDADLMIDPVAHTWTQIYPVVSGPAATTTQLSVTPNPSTVGSAVTLTASESPAVNGSVQFRDGSAAVGTPVEVDASGKAIVSTSTLTAGTHSLTAVFTPTDASAYSGSTSTVVTATVNAAPHASSLVLSGTKAVKYGQSLTLTGTLKDSTAGALLAGQSVTLKQRASAKAAFTTVRTLTTSTKGVASVSVKPGATTQYQWTYAGTSTHKPASSSIGSVTVAPTVTAAANHASIRHGSSVSVYGTVAPAITNQRVTLQVLSGKTWKSTTTTAVQKKQKLPNGKTVVGFVLTLKVATKGVYSYRVYLPATTTRSAGYSGTVKVTAS